MPALINNNEIEEVIRLLQVDPQGAIDEAKRLLNRSEDSLVLLRCLSEEEGSSLVDW